MQENFLGHLFWQIHCIQDPCTFCKCANGIVLSQENAETFLFEISFSNWKLNEFKFVSAWARNGVCKLLSICMKSAANCKFWNRFLLLWKNPPLHFFSPRAIIIFSYRLLNPNIFFPIWNLIVLIYYIWETKLKKHFVTKIVLTFHCSNKLF